MPLTDQIQANEHVNSTTHDLTDICCIQEGQPGGLLSPMCLQTQGEYTPIMGRTLSCPSLALNHNHSPDYVCRSAVQEIGMGPQAVAMHAASLYTWAG